MENTLSNFPKYLRQPWRIVWLILLACGLGAAAAQAQTTRYVRADGTGDGSSWANASGDLQAMINASSAGDQVWVASGTYKPTTSAADRDASFSMKEGVAILGGFPATGDPGLSGRDANPATNGTVLSGDIDNDGTKAGNSLHVVYNYDNGLTDSAVLDGFTITGGNADGDSSPKEDGAGMYNFKSSPMLSNCAFLDNKANDVGGGMYNDSSSPTLTNCVFQNDSAKGGGGMYNNVSDVTVTDCSFLNNSGTSIGGGMSSFRGVQVLTNCTFQGNSSRSGGGMYNFNNSPTVTNCNFQDNSARGGGGMTNLSNTNATVTHCTFQSNSSNSGGGGGMINFGNTVVDDCSFLDNSSNGRGGGMYNFEANTVTNCFFQDNKSKTGGGGMTNQSGSATVSNCTFQGNSTPSQGGGIYNLSSGSVVTNCAFVDNVGKIGGAMANASGNPKVTNCSFLSNSATNDGGAIYGSSSSFTLTNCSFQRNSASDDGWAIVHSRGNPTLVNCVLWDNGGAKTIESFQGTLTVAYSLLEPSVTNYTDGGNDLTTTTNPFVSNASTELRECSPAIDAGDDAANATPTDLAGNPRRVGRIDMGAYEYPVARPTATLSGGGAVCAGQPLPDVSIALTGAAPFTFTYSDGTTSTDVTTSDNPYVIANAPVGTYTVTAIDDANECPGTTSNSVAVSVNPLPTVTPGPEQTVFLGYGSTCTDISATASGSTGPYTYTWSGSSETGSAIEVCPETTTTYTVTATDANGCTSAEAAEITVTVQDVRCGPKQDKVTICYYGVTQCVSNKIAKRYLKLGATLGSCDSAAARLGAPESDELPLKLSLKAYPNPVADAMTIEVISPLAGKGTFEVLDLQGVARQTRTKYLQEGLNEVEFRLGSLPTGIYLIRGVDAANRQGTVRINKR